MLNLFQSYRLKGELITAWKDARLEFPENKTDTIILEPEIIQKLWIPDLFIGSLQYVETTQLLSRNQRVTLSKQDKKISMSIK